VSAVVCRIDTSGRWLHRVYLTETSWSDNHDLAVVFRNHNQAETTASGHSGAFAVVIADSPPPKRPTRR